MPQRDLAAWRVVSVLPALGACLLAACGQGENDPGPGGVTVGEARALDDAAQMLEDRRLAPEDLQTPAATVPGGAHTTGPEGDMAR